MGKIYILFESYRPNTAFANRAISYFQSWESNKEEVNVIYFLPDEKKSKINISYKYIHVSYLWDKYYVDNPALKYLSYIWYVYSFVRKLKKDDVVYLYGLNDVKDYIISKKACSKYFFESTECPDVSLPCSRLHRCSVAEHIETLKKVDGLFVISQNLKNYYVDKGISESRIHIINMTVDPSRFENIEKEDTCDKYIAYCGTASNNKDGVDELIKSFAIVSKRHPEYKLYIIGKTPSKQDSSGNLQLVEDLGVSEKVIFTGVISSEQMPQILTNAKILALDRPDNTQAKYGFPTKLGEYLLTGNPVVVTRVGDIPNFLTHGQNAYLAEPENPIDFSEKLCWCIEHYDEAIRVGEAGKQVAIENFNADKEAQKLIKLMTTL